MSLKAVLIGGVIPSILLGLGTVLMKLSFKNGISIFMYLAVVGSCILSIGIVLSIYYKEFNVNLFSATYAIAMGFSWSFAILCMSYAISKLDIAVSIIAPITNSNAIVAVMLGAVIFAEYKNLDFQKVLIGTILIIIGAIVVSSSQK